ncbi:hypothetical protein [Streptomyces sp. NPDC056670]|uniref:hypothetical protein n=1 Tax=Streptomyces sp. NPDC056670 TaxID=3345904 RepID=UPI0036AC3C85
MNYRPALHTVVIGACTTALVVGAGLLTLPAQAHSQQAPSTAGTRLSSRAEMHVGEFFQEYLDAVDHIQHEGKNTFEIRKEYLSTELDDALTVWGSEHQLDPVVRAQNPPKTWSTAEDTSTPTHTKIILTENWADGTSTKIWYQVRLSDLVIDSLTGPVT